jgi:hypothetical protein
MSSKTDDLFEDVELQTPSNTRTGVVDIIDDGRPKTTDPGWNDYVLSLFEDNEMYDGRPLCHGLRRVAEFLFGDIVISRPTKVFPPQDDNGIGRATVIWEIVFENGQSFSDVADCWEGNTDDTFCVFNTATAATRAEGRALRKALRLRVVAAEEVTKKNTAEIVKSISQTNAIQSTQGEYQSTGRMTENQERFIDGKSKQLDINPAKLFKDVFNLSVSRKIDKKQASDAIEKLNEYQQNKDLIPSSITGYQEDWRNA